MADRISGASVACGGDSSPFCLPKRETCYKSQTDGLLEGESESDSESYWPVLRSRRLGQQGAAEGPTRGKCPICYDECIDSLGEDDSNSSSSNEEFHGIKDRIIVPCGHIFCRTCTKKIQRQREPFCPMCRYKLSCPKCGVHPLQLRTPTPGGHGNPRGPTPAPAKSRPGGQIDLSWAAFPPSELVCPRCTAQSQWKDLIKRGEWPEGTSQITPGFVQFVYHMAAELEEQEGRTVTYTAVINAFAAVMEAEFTNLMAHRDRYLDTTVKHMSAQENATPWFEYDSSMRPRVPQRRGRAV